MTPVIKVDASEVGCRKPGCKRKLAIPQRHHRAYHTLFIRAFRDRANTKKYKRLVKRYNAFVEADVVRLCAWHHCEIHNEYGEVIRRFVRQARRLHLMLLSWKEAEQLMLELTQYCLEWEKRETPGCNPKLCWDNDDAD